MLIKKPEWYKLKPEVIKNDKTWLKIKNQIVFVNGNIKQCCV